MFNTSKTCIEMKKIFFGKTGNTDIVGIWQHLALKTKLPPPPPVLYIVTERSVRWLRLMAHLVIKVDIYNTPCHSIKLKSKSAPTGEITQRLAAEEDDNDFQWLFPLARKTHCQIINGTLNMCLVCGAAD